MIDNCRRTIDLLPAYVDGAFSPEQERNFRAHLAICPRCVEFVESYRGTSRVIREATDADLPAEAERRLLDFLAGLGPRRE